jgi:hypothetical protein
MNNKFLYGVPVVSLSDVVMDFGDEQGNSGQKHFAKNLKHAHWAWKDLLWTTIFSMAHKSIEVKEGKITLPNDLVRLIMIYVVDSCGKIQPINYGPSFNTVEVTCPPVSVSCSCGGNDTLCAALDEISMVTEDVELNGDTYTKTIWTKKQGSDLVQIAHTPFWNSEGEGSVEYKDITTRLCELEVTEAGCVKVTEPNKTKLQEYCGCISSCFSTADKCQSPFVDNIGDYGSFNYDAEKSNVIHLKDFPGQRVIVRYQTSGDTDGQEIMVPEYAVDAVKFGILYRQASFSPVRSISEKKSAKYDYKEQKTSLFKFLNPIKLSEFVQIGQKPRKW